MSFGTIPLSPDDKPDGFVLLSMYEKLESENAKLRELVRDMYTVMVTDAANCDVTYPEQFDDRMRELGVEMTNG